MVRLPLIEASDGLCAEQEKPTCSSGVACDNANNKCGTKKFTCGWENKGVGCEDGELRSSWSIPPSRKYRIPSRMVWRRGCESVAGCDGGVLNEVEVWSATLPRSLAKIGVCTLGVHVHWTWTSPNMMIPILRVGLIIFRGMRNIRESKRLWPMLRLSQKQKEEDNESKLEGCLAGVSKS